MPDSNVGPNEHNATVLSTGKHCYQGLKSGWDLFNDNYKLNKPHWPIGKKNPGYNNGVSVSDSWTLKYNKMLLNGR